MSFSKRLALLAAVAALPVAGCNCNNGTAKPGQPTIAILSPVDGVHLSAKDDLAPETLDLQIDVKVSTSHLASGDKVSLKVDGGTALTMAPGNDGTATFKLVTLSPGAHKLTATAKSATATANVTADIPSGPRCVLHDPKPGATLGAADDADKATPGFQHDVEFDCAEVPDGAASLKVGDHAALAGSVASGKALFTAVSLAEGQNTLVLAVANPAVTASGEVTVSTGACTASLSPPDGQVFNARGEGPGAIADRDGTTPGEQVRLTLTTACPDGASAQLVVDGANLGNAVTVANGQAIFDVTLPDGQDAVAAVVTGATSGYALPVSYTVDSVIPTCDVTDPASGATLGNAQDTDPGTPGMQYAVKAQCSGLVAGGALVLTATGPGGLPTTYNATLDANLGATFNVDLANGQSTLSVTGARPSGTTATSAGVTVDVNWVSNAAITITAPQDTALFNASQDADPGTAGFQVAFTVSAPGLDGATGTLSCANGPSAPITIAGGAASAMLTFAPTACSITSYACDATVTGSNGQVYSTSPSTHIGVDLTPPTVAITDPTAGQQIATASYNVVATTTCVEDGQSATVSVNGGAPVTATVTSNVASFSNVVLQQGQDTLVAGVSDQAGNSGTSTPVMVTVNSVTPAVSFTVPTAGTAWTTADDQSPTAPGFQHDVTLAISNSNKIVLAAQQPDGAGGWLAPQTLGTYFPLATDTAYTFPQVTIPEGSVRLVATVWSGPLQSASTTVDVTVTTGASTCAIASPADGAYLGLAARVGTTSNAAADVTVLTDATAVTIVVTDSTGTQVYTATGTPASGSVTLAAAQFTSLAGGANTLAATCGAGATASNAVAHTIHVDFQPPVLGITTPPNNSWLNASAPDTDPATAGFQTAVTVAADSIEDGQVATLTVDCGAGPTTYTASFATNQAQFPKVTLADQSTCTLTASASDKAGNAAAPVSSSVKVDRVPPSPAITDPANGAKLGVAADADPGTPGIQYNVVVSSAQGDGVTLSVNGGAPLGPQTVGSTGSVTFVRVTIPDGVDTVAATATDPAGNATTFTITVTADSNAPSIAMSRPTNGSILNVSSDIDLTTSGIQYPVDITTSGLASGATVTLCGTLGTGAACKTAGTFQMATATVGSNAATFYPTFPDGSQTIVAEGSDGINSAASAPVSVVVDSVPPVIATFKVTTDANSDGYVNAAELAATGGKLAFSMTDNDSDIANQPASVTDDNPAGTDASGTWTAATIALTATASPAQGLHHLIAHSVDVHGNANIIPSAGIDNPAAHLAVTVKTSGPTIAWTAPTKSTLNAADDTNPATPSVLDYTISVSVSADATGSVTFTVDGTPSTAPIASGTASLAVQLGQGAHALVASVADIAGNVTTTPANNVTVDTIPPSLTITSPTAGATLGAADFVVTVSTGTSLETGRTISVISSATGTSVGSAPCASGGTTSVNVVAPKGAQNLTAQATDAAGNPGTSPAVAVTVNASCTLTWVQPPGGGTVYYGAADDLSASTPGLQTNIQTNTTDCKGQPVTLTLSTGGVYGPVTADPTTGDALFSSVTLNDNTTTTVTASIDPGGGNPPTTASYTAVVKLTAPAITSTTPSAASVTYVASSGNPAVNGTTIIADLVAGAPLDASFGETVTGANGGTATLKAGATVLASQAITSDPYTANFNGVQIAQKSNPTISFCATDTSNNTTCKTMTTVVDVVPPGAFTVTGTVSNTRHADVALAWTAPGDDGATGTVTSYQVAWSTVTDASGPVGQPGLTIAGPAAPVAGGSAQTFPVNGLPPINMYSFTVTAVDGVGNTSVAPAAQVANLWNHVAVANPAATNTLYGAVLTNAGDLDGDGFDDLLVSDTQGDGHVYAYFGAANLGAWSAPDVTLNGGAGSGERYGYATAGNADVSGDGRPDVLIGAPSFTAVGGSTWGHAYLYFGVAASKTLSAPIEFRGPVDASSNPVAARYGRSVAFVGDVNGDGIADFVIDASDDNGYFGRAYLFFGRTATAWATLAGAKGYVAAAQADRTFTGGTSNDSMGYRFGLTTLGDLDGDGKAEIGLPLSNVSKESLFSGATVTATTGRDLLGSDAVATLTDGTFYVGQAGFSTWMNGFGARAIGGLDFNGDGYPDLFVTNSWGQLAYVYLGNSAAKAISTTATQTWSGAGGLYGLAADAANIDGDTGNLADLIVGNDTNNTSFMGAMLYFSHGGATPFPAAYTTKLTQPGATQASYFGLGVALGKFNGSVSIVVGAPKDSTNGKVHVWY